MRSISQKLTILTWIIYILLLIVACAPFLQFIWPISASFFPPNEIVARYGGVDALSLWQQISGFFVAALPSVLLCWALALVLKLISYLKAGLWFDEACEKLCKTFSKIMLWFVLAQFLHRTLLVLVITATNPVGKRELMVAISTEDVFALVPVVFALIFAHIISLAREQRDELKQII